MKKSYIKRLVEYIKKNISKGYNVESLKWALINQGVNRSSVNRAIKIANKELAEKIPKFEEKEEKKKHKEPVLVNLEKSRLSSRVKNFFKNLVEIFKS